MIAARSGVPTLVPVVSTIAPTNVLSRIGGVGRRLIMCHVGLRSMIRVGIACDIRLYREGLQHQLAQEERLGMVGAASTAEETYRLAREIAPDVLLLDMAMRDSLELAHELRGMAPATRVLALTIPEADSAVVACAEAGVAGFVTRDASLSELVQAICSAARGEACMSPRAAAALLRRVGDLAADRPQSTPPRGELTAREREIVELVALGLSNKAIAARLHVEIATVKNHVHNILDKLQVHRRGEIAASLGRSPASAPLHLTLGDSHREVPR